jgi:hypothetical protein
VKWRATSNGKRYSYAPRLPEYNRINSFTMQGKALFYQNYKNNLKAWDNPLCITADDIRKGINSANEQKTAYHPDADENLYALLTDDIDISRNIVAIYGCTTPWYACIALAHGAKGVVIISHQEVQCEDERIVCAKPDEVKAGCADYVISICEMQAEGLGGFGEDVDANADIAAMGVCHKILKEKGKLLLSLPCGRDMVVWNKRRIYGRRRLKLMFEEWTLRLSVGWDAKSAKAITYTDDFTPLFVLEKR